MHQIYSQRVQWLFVPKSSMCMMTYFSFCHVCCAQCRWTCCYWRSCSRYQRPRRRQRNNAQRFWRIRTTKWHALWKDLSALLLTKYFSCTVWQNPLLTCVLGSRAICQEWQFLRRVFYSTACSVWQCTLAILWVSSWVQLYFACMYHAGNNKILFSSV